jgi:hypothetical protein
MKCADRGDNCCLSIVDKGDEWRRFARLDSESRDRESRGIGAIATWLVARGRRRGRLESYVRP